MPLEKRPFYDPVPPSYDEALAGSSRRSGAPRPPADDEADEAESHALLPHAESSAASSRRPHGYRPPTVETDDDDDDSLFGSDSDASSDADDDDDDDDDEAAQVRREMQEMDMEEPSRTLGSVWSKRIGGFKLSLPRWKWSWRPRLPRLRIRLPSSQPAGAEEEEEEEGGGGGGDHNGTGDGEVAAAAAAAAGQDRRWRLPGVDQLVLVLAFARVVALVIVVGFLYFLFASGVFGSLSWGLDGGRRLDPEELRQHVMHNIEAMRLRASVQHFSHYAHLAGTEGDYATAMDVERMFHRAGLDQVVVDEYYVYLNYPRKDGRAVQVLDGDTAVWSARLDEEERGGETAGRQTYAFHGHSKAGDVRGPLVYANYGSRDDFRALREAGVDTQGAIALVRHYGSEADTALKVRAAELAGCAGCLIYSDPADDGFVRGPVAPGGRFMPADGVRRGAVSMLGWVMGDVLTPGWESKKDRPRIKVNETAGLARIPSLPLAWRDAQQLLRRLRGHGQPVPAGWTGGVPDVGAWWTGNASSPVVRLRNEQDEAEQQPVWNVYGKIAGTEQPARSIMVGNHRDAWAFGAVDPHSGTAVMMELARILGGLAARGWRPLRTIEFMSWDAGAYNLVGSTEFVENNVGALRDGAYAYLNLDAAVAGPRFRAAGSPALQRALQRALGRVVDADANATLRALWAPPAGRLAPLGGAGDYVAFQHVAGTSSLDLGFAGDRLPCHSSYETFALVDAVVDPGFAYHTLLAQVVGLLLLDLADRPVLPLDMLAYADALDAWVADLAAWLAARDAHVPLAELRDAVALVKRNAADFARWELEWDRLVLMNAGLEAGKLAAARLGYNDKMAAFETALLDLELGGGIPNRTQFKHVVFGPQLWSASDGALFPAIRDTVEAGDMALARRITAKTAAILRKAAAGLRMDDE